MASGLLRRAFLCLSDFGVSFVHAGAFCLWCWVSRLVLYLVLLVYTNHLSHLLHLLSYLFGLRPDTQQWGGVVVVGP